jgi:hypothetical protein
MAPGLHHHLCHSLQIEITGVHMNENIWRELCEAIMQENDSQKLLALVEELNQVLDERHVDLQQRRTPVSERSELQRVQNSSE